MKNDLSTLPEGSRTEPLRVCHCLNCRQSVRRQQTPRRHGILSSYSIESGPGAKAKSSAARTIQVAGYWLLFLAAALTLATAVTLITMFCFAGKPVCLFLALCLAVLAAIIITQF
jgi:hypothetical protein